jgi:hypothetical protein
MSEISPDKNKPGGLGILSGPFGSWVLPCISPRFYADAIQRPTIRALGFFTVFTLVLSLVESIVVAFIVGHEAIALFAAVKEQFWPHPIPTIEISANGIVIYD